MGAPWKKRDHHEEDATSVEWTIEQHRDGGGSDEMENAGAKDPAFSSKEKPKNGTAGSDSSSSTTTATASVREVLSFARTRKTKLYIGAAVASSVVSGATMPAMAFYFAKAFEDLSASASGETFLAAVREIAFTFMILGFLILVAMTMQSTCMEIAAGEMTRNMKQSWFEALLRQDMAYYDIQDVTGQATLISSNGRKYRKGVGRKLAEAVQFACAFFGAMIYSFVASWQVTLALIAISPVLILSGYYVIQITSTHTARSNAAYAKAGAVVTTAVTSIRTILSLNAVEKMVGLYKASTADACREAISNAWLAGLANGSNYVSMVLAYAMVTGFGTFLLYKGVRETGCDPSGTVENQLTCDPSGIDVFGALMGVSIAAAVLPQISLTMEAFAGARSACYPAIVAMSRKLERDEEEKDVESARRSSHHVRRELESLPKYAIDSFSTIGLKPNRVKGKIEFKNVSFSFPARPEAQILKNFSMTIEAGKTVALVGPSGSGKSTVVQLIERFYDPITGSVTLDGVDLKSLNTRWLREQIGLVLQEPKLFGKSIRENISLGSPGVTREQIESAARMANAHDFIMSFPRGYDTQVGDLGSQLSGGQKQRISIARILVKNPKIVLLDEATSALDSESEAAVQKALDGLMRLEGVTTFVIAHRLSTIKNADVIAVMKEGSVVESGTHDELLSMREAYFDLVEAQRSHSDSTSTDSLDDDENGREIAPIDPSIYSQTYFPSDETLDPDIISFHDVRFRYPARDHIEVFKGLSFSVRKGETLALVGPSGSGKSSVVQLIECFYHPTEGSIEYCGIDLRDINVRWLRDELGLVSQEATLFNTTVEENIRYGSPEATKEQVVEAAKQANCHDFIMSFPDGYQTLIGEGGSLVSGGEKQRIAIARAILKQPSLLLLDEATSALDSENEKVVQAALDKITSDRSQTCIVIAHRLSTIRNADRIAFVEHGQIREIGKHERLMAIPNGRYRRLQELQNLDANVENKDKITSELDGAYLSVSESGEEAAETTKEEQCAEEEVEEVSKEEAAINSKRAWLLGSQDLPSILVGALGATIVGLFFPGWGIAFSFMIDTFYRKVAPCPLFPPDYSSCFQYRNAVANEMRDTSLKVLYAYFGLCGAALIGSIVLYWGFRSASERMNKRVRDAAFTNLLRQEVGWFDMRAPGTITSQLSDDAALLHAFAGEPVRTITVSVASVLVGLVVSFVFMWPFALLTLAMLPFLSFGAEMEMRTYLGEDEGDLEDNQQDEHSPGGIVVETLSNMRTVASLTMEHTRAEEYHTALEKEDPHPIRTNLVKGSFSGIGQFLQYWCLALMFWWGGWLLIKYPETFSYQSYLISMMSLFFSIYGLTVAFEGAVDREKAKAAAQRIFALTDRQSQIDPLSGEGKKRD